MAGLNLENKEIVLLLQGGGALGAYQVGAFEALSERCEINWVAGISIGAINASVIAGNEHKSAVAELHALWDEILLPQYLPFDVNGLWRLMTPNSWLQALEPKYCNWSSMAFPLGLNNFFSSRVMIPPLNPWVMQWFRKLNLDEMSFYSTSPLRRTLEKHVNWNLINAPTGVRLFLGATSITTGEVVLFDSAAEKIAIEHVMASGALPPAFPPVEVHRKMNPGHQAEHLDDWYFDGGVSNNTPVECLQDEFDDCNKSTIVFAIDIWDRKCSLRADQQIESFDELLWRQKSIQYGSRKKAAEKVVDAHERKVKLGEAEDCLLEVCQVMYESDGEEQQFSFSDADFSHATYIKLREQGRKDMTRALDSAEAIPGIGGPKSKLYRVGSRDKHIQTDKKFAARMQPPRKAPLSRKPAG